MDKELRDLIRYKMTGKKTHKKPRKGRLLRIERCLNTRKGRLLLWPLGWLYSVVILAILDLVFWMVNFLLGLVL